MRARLKTDPWDVWQYGNTALGLPGWVLACTIGNSNNELFLRRRSGLQMLHKGDWIIRDIDGGPTWSSDAEFQRDYEIVDA